MHVRRQGNNATGLQWQVGVDRDDSAAIGKNLGHERGRTVNHAGRAEAHFATRFDQTTPATSPELFQKQKFDRTIIGKSARRDDASIVQNEQIAVAQKCSKLDKAPMFDSLAPAMEHHHARILPPWERPLRDEFFR